MEFERDPETSDTDNDVQFKVSSSFFLKNSISGWDRGHQFPYAPPGDGKEREFGYKSEPSLRGGAWCDNLLSGVRVNEETEKQDKIRLFTLNS